MKTSKLLFALLIITGLTTAKNEVKAQADTANITFKNTANLPYPLTWNTPVTDGTYIYAIAGYQGRGGYSNDVLKYDPQVNRWSVLTNIGGNRIQAAAAYVPVTNKIYVFGGISGQGRATNIYQSVQTIDVKTGEVANLHAQNPEATTYGCAVEYNNKIYLFGGSREKERTSNSLYEFDPQTEKFTQLAAMPESLQAAGTVVNGVIYTVGGYDAFLKRQSSNVNAYDIKTNTWKTVCKMPQFMSANSVAALGDKIFITGAYDDEYLTAYYDISTNKFVKLKSNMEPRRATASAVFNNYLFVFGGTSRFKAANASTLQSAQVANLSGFLRTSASK
ncbi:Kelch repeat-containing protein [Mucilaginibacter flavus]|uniref:Kelch repeat-containing protein n=1 Tax=Mucilaginibacter flavus TaxID=931504 RepID=UPI0025B41EE0|nr:kelch repeat-containing protein [Mucilaginibacter flavus]MDN3579896.1 kelch repeat-containing protein [Mucilaginibacter flavus]